MPYLGRTVVTNLADYHVDGYTHVGSSPSSSQFIAGTTSALTLTNTGVEDEQALSVYFNGLHQQHNTYTISNSVVTFDAAIPTGTDKVEIHYGTQPVTSGLAADSVGASQIAINSVAGTKIAMGSDAAGDILYYNGTDYIRLGKGTSGHFLKIGASAPSWAAAGGAWNLIGTAVASDSANLTITGLDSTYDSYAIAISDAVPATDNVKPMFRLGDSSGVDSGASDYGHYTLLNSIQSTAHALTGFEDNSDAQILFGTDASAANGVGNASGEGVTGMFFLNSPGDGTSKSTISGTGTFQDISGTIHGFTVYGGRLSVITHDRVLFQFHSGNVATGRMTIWGIAHA